MTREPIYEAVFAFFSALTVGEAAAFRMATRKVAPWSDVDPTETPALLMEQGQQVAQYRKGFPTIWRCSIRLLLYVHTGALDDQTIIPSQIFNPLIDMIESAITVDDQSNDACTLGGLVSHCAIEGPIQIFEGTLGNEACVVIPIYFLTSP